MSIHHRFHHCQQFCCCVLSASFLENGNGSSGEGVFGNYTSTTFDLVDHTDPGTTYQRVQWLNGGASGRVGLTKSLSVMPGDRVSVTAYAKYRNLTGTGNANPFAAALTAAFGVSSGSTGEQLKLYNSLNAYGVSVAGGNHPADDDTAPKAFVTILLFDKNYNLLDAAWDQVTTTLEQVSATNKEAFDHALSKEVTVQEAGYAYVFVSNEHPTYVDVYFDDVTVGHTLSPIVSSSDYYPFGLTFNSGEKQGNVKQNNLYNGKELQDELAMNWYDYGARMYMPEIGRWGVIDPHADKYEITTPFNYAFNNPLLFVDPTGRDNIIYLLVAGKFDKTEAQAIQDRANAYLKDLGLETRVQLFQGDDFHVEGLDETDNWAVIGNSRKEIARKVNSINKEYNEGSKDATRGEDYYSAHVESWADRNEENNPEVSDRHIGGRGISVDHNRGNVGSHKSNLRKDAIGGSAMSIIHGAAHSSKVIQGDYGKTGLGNKDGHTSSGVMMDGNGLIAGFRTVGASGIIDQDNSAYIKAMTDRYGSNKATDNYSDNLLNKK